MQAVIRGNEDLVDDAGLQILDRCVSGKISRLWH